ncbi:uncharacterized protein JN550_008473 [Neoarthrinium moseri]|uniref:uncharacterized protein n=1 Tax=Neoarthrinium moseri TaxID=1658444 RepID=UPI001FDB95E2|nr:uncharacterized protein JN550_008473 [Neoarthrinium moseri]KAI1865425.1 hypothetical protein JN550_008473 [Neoarthrinium moseri]
MKSLPQKIVILAALVSAALAYSSEYFSASACTKVRQRVPWTSLTKEEKKSYIQADLCLMKAPSKLGIPGAVTRWDDIQWPHVVQTASVHFVGAFLPFHRYYMTAHERLIRDECGYTGRYPYWDEPADIGKLAQSELWSDEYFGGDGTGPGGCIETGPFANLTLRWTQDKRSVPHCLVRRFNELALTLASNASRERCNALDNFVDAWNCLEAGPHGSGHGAVGGLMSDPTLSPGDPIFYLHHSWLDKLWWEWQKGNSSKRLSDVGGLNTPSFGSFPGGPSSGFPNGTFPGFPGNGSFPGFPGNGSFPGFPGNGSFPGLPGNGSFPGFPGNGSFPGIPGFGLGGGGPEFSEYFGDNGNWTTLNHRLYMAEIFPNITIGDVMNVNGDVVCSEYLNA